jgi:hypothetical protein
VYVYLLNANIPPANFLLVSSIFERMNDPKNKGDAKAVANAIVDSNEPCAEMIVTVAMFVEARSKCSSCHEILNARNLTSK